VIALSVTTGWHVAILLMAGLALVGPVAVLLADEPEVTARPPGFFAAVRAPVTEFLARRGAVVIIAFIVLFRLGEALAGWRLPWRMVRFPWRRHCWGQPLAGFWYSGLAWGGRCWSRRFSRRPRC
jgi:hypothetical protein